MSKKRVLNYLSNEEIHKLLNFISSQRDRLLVRILFETGCTVNELIQIKNKDIDSKQNVIRFPASSTKSSHAKVSCISKSLSSDITEFNAQGEYLFSTRQSALMTTKRVRQLIQFYGKNAGFPTKLNPQVLRYSHIAHALETGIPLNAIQEQTGLEKLRLMQIYEAIVPETLDNAYKMFFDK